MLHPFPVLLLDKLTLPQLTLVCMLHLTLMPTNDGTTALAFAALVWLELTICGLRLPGLSCKKVHLSPKLRS